MPLTPPTPVTLFASDSVTVTAWQGLNVITRKTERKGAEPVLEHFERASLRKRDGQWYIGGPGAPGPNWKPAEAAGVRASMTVAAGHSLPILAVELEEQDQPAEGEE